MKRLALLLFATSLAAWTNPQLKEVQTVYLLPMGNALDQYLATQFTRLGVLQVVTDPQKADAVLTDRVGRAFEQRLDELYPPPPAKKDDKQDKARDEEKQAVHISAFGGGRGNLFLVDRKTRLVLWSTYQRPKNTSPDELNHTSERIVQQIKNDLKAK